MRLALQMKCLVGCLRRLTRRSQKSRSRVVSALKQLIELRKRPNVHDQVEDLWAEILAYSDEEELEDRACDVLEVVSIRTSSSRDKTSYSRFQVDSFRTVLHRR